jgi:NOL1/NOP2/sun family putative RNA methylase
MRKLPKPGEYVTLPPMRDHLPPEFVRRMRDLLGEETADFLRHYDDPPAAGLRVNTLKLSVEEFKERIPFDLTPLPWAPAGFEFHSKLDSPGLHPYHAAGLYYIQEPAAQAVAEVLDPQPGERILDLAAAPGGKTTDIAARMDGRGLLVANEIHPRRVWDLVKNMERWGARNAVITNESPENLVERLPAFFDRVLVDAPCSGEGMFRKMPEAVRDWSPEFVQGCAVRQTGILVAAAGLVRPGGWLCYSTCTFAAEENERVIAQFLDAHADFELAAPDWMPGYAAAITGDGRFRWPHSPVRLWPHRAPGEGHFIALLRRAGPFERPRNGLTPPLSALVPSRLTPFWQQFAAESLRFAVPLENLRLVKSYLYAQPPETPDLRGLRLVRPGWWLGSFKKDRFEPAHALAMGLGPEDTHFSFALEGDDIASYLRCEALRVDGPLGWKLALLEGQFPLGWGKQVSGQLKNHYPKGLRVF